MNDLIQKLFTAGKITYRPFFKRERMIVND